MIDKSFSFVLAYPSDVVKGILDRFQPKKGDVVLDPFAGTGTTLVECKRRGLRSIGIESNPVCALATSAKTHWNVDTKEVESAIGEVVASARRRVGVVEARHIHANRFFNAPEVRSLSGYQSVVNSGVVERGWIGRRLAVTALSLSHYIRRIPDDKVRDFLMVSLLGSLVPDFSNLKYGPELYRARQRPPETDGFHSFRSRAINFSNSVREHRGLHGDTKATLVLGNSMEDSTYAKIGTPIKYVITSPPYPAEHDYTRMTRLELGFGGFLEDSEELQRIKRGMIPSSSKSSYVSQKFYDHVRRFRGVRELRDKIFEKSKGHDHGFARVYPRLVGDYFGAMYLHLKALSEFLPRGAKCAYVVGDQSSFFGVRIQTAEIFSQLINSERMDFHVDGIETLRIRRATRGCGQKKLPEKIIYFQKQ